jgi:hypothetical protein
MEIATQQQRSSTIGQRAPLFGLAAVVVAIIAISAVVAWLVLGSVSTPYDERNNGILINGLPAPALVGHRHGEQGSSARVAPAAVGGGTSGALDARSNGILVDGQPRPALIEQRHGEQSGD